MKLLKKLAVWTLAVSMVVSPMSINVYAADEEKTDIVDNGEKVSEISANEELAESIEENMSEDFSQQTDADTNSTNTEATIEVSDKEKAFEYVYMDEQIVNIPEEQNIVVAFADTDIKIESATLYGTIVESEETFEIPSSNIVDNTVLFTKNYTKEEVIGTYKLDGISYQIMGMEQDVNVSFEEQDVTAQYIVTTEPEKEIVTEDSGAVPEVSVYSIDDAGNAVQQSGDTGSIEDSVETVLSTVDDTATEENVGTSKARTAEETGDKVIVICAGHDANHPGASGSGLREEQLTFKVAQYCKAELEQYTGVKVYMDRSSVSCAYPGQTSSYCLNQRVIDAAEKGATTFVDIHFNKANGAAYGAEVYVPNNSYSSAIHQDGENLGNNILAQLSALGLYNRGTKVKDCTTNDRDENGILEDYFTTNNLSKAYGMTGIIVEHAFLDNASDAAKLKNESFLQQLGVADATGIANAYGLTKGAKIEILNKDDFEGTAQIKITGAGSGARVAIWSSVDGQDDLKWIDINNSQTINFNIKDYKNSTGTYNVHLYGANGSFTATTFKVSTDTTSKLTITNVNEQDKTFHLTLKFNDMPDEITAIQFPTWQDKKQSDLKWYQGKQTSKGTWEVDVPLSEHKLAGTYQVHVYATNSSGKLRVVNKGEFTVSEPTVSKLQVENYNQNAGTFDVVVSGISSKSGVEKVMIPVWSTSNQSDIVWYTASKQTDGSYKVKVSIANHQYHTGTYQIHMYLTAGNGLTAFKNTTQVVKEVQATIEATDTSNGKESTYQLKASNVGVYGNTYRAVQFAVWSEKGGQDDLVWYSAKNTGSNQWTTNIEIKNHKTVGEYHVHTYGTLSNGTLQFIGQTSFTIQQPEMSTTIQNYDQKRGTFEVVAKNIKSVSGVDGISVAVWSEKNQGNLKWYNAEKQSDGSYKTTVSIANHKYLEGEYNVHVYMTTGNGISYGRVAGTQKMGMPKLDISVSDVDGKQTMYQMKTQNADMVGTVKNIQYAVWSEKNGQDDLIWYSSTKNQLGEWVATADIRKHKTEGKYNVHVYATMTDGSMRFMGAETFEITAPTFSGNIENYNAEQGSFDVVITGIKSVAGVSSVSVPVWSTANQSNIVWYPANLQKDGSYKVTVKIANHNYLDGTYNVHTYLTTNNGITKGIVVGQQKMTRPQIKVTAENTDKKEIQYALKAINTDIAGDVKNVQFATWSDKNGQDDLIWYQAKKESTGQWTATADVKKHKTTGKYEVHAYATMANGALQFLGNTTFTVTEPDISGTIKVENYNESTGAFTVKITVKSNVVLSNVQVPVWSESGQGDIKWYEATLNKDGSYEVQVDPSNHKYNTGVYKIHVYATTANEFMRFIGSSSQTVVAPAYYTIMGDTTVTLSQMVKYYKSSKRAYPTEVLSKGGAETIEDFCQMYLDEAQAEGVKAEVAFAQAMKETAWLQYGGIVKIEQFNYAGIGALDGNISGQCASFPDVRTGIRAQIQHLKAYASTDALVNEQVDPRFHLVRRGVVPYVEWLGIKENPQGVGWASEKNYGISVVNYIKTLKSM